jgi:ABC-2 type transport system ATP-binding protein
VSKRFGSTLALDGLSFAVMAGQVSGLAGPKGAGKSTTMRVILGLDAADQGSATIGGRGYRSLHNPLCQVGSLLNAAALQPSRTGRNHLMRLAHSQGLGIKRVDEVIEQSGLETATRCRAGGYALGMRQRLGRAAALLGDPPVLLFDEPFNGVEPVALKGEHLETQDRPPRGGDGRRRGLTRRGRRDQHRAGRHEPQPVSGPDTT